MTEPTVYASFYMPCLDCGETLHVTEGVQDDHQCTAPIAEVDDSTRALVAQAWWAGHDAALDAGDGAA